jgi:ParB-like chromosome segregation protein Spo0J
VEPERFFVEPRRHERMSEVKENKLVPLALLFPHERNYRAHPESQIIKLAASLERFGQVRSIVTQACENGSYTIVAGHGVVLAAERLKYSDLRADILPASWSQAQIEGYLVADNNLSSEAVDDDTLLATLLQEQQDAGYDLASLGSDDETLRQMLENLTPASGDEWSNALGDLPDGEKSPFQQMTFTLSNEQADMVKEALDLAQEDKDHFEDMGNQNSNGNALAYVVRFYLDMGKGGSDE